MSCGYYAEASLDPLRSGASLYLAIPPSVKIMKRKTTRTIFLLLAAFAFFSFAPFATREHALMPALAAPTAQISFDRDIRPILAERCLACHGEKKQSGGLRLDTKSFAMRGGQSGPVIVAGKAAESRLYQRIAAKNDDERMPPTGERLTAAQVALLKAWIDAGAVWTEGEGETRRQGEGENSQHWAWQPIKRPAVPSTPAKIHNPQSAFSNGRNPIDAFISARLAQVGLMMSPEADRRTLIRRLSFDLLGLPP